MCDMEFFGHTGCLPEEKENGQTFVVTCDMGIDDIPGKYTDDLEDTIDYSVVYEVIRKVVESSYGNLIEHLAYEIGSEVVSCDPRIEEAVITVSKPQAPIEGTFRTMETTITVKRAHKVYLSLGSNMGDREANLKEAIRRLCDSEKISDVRWSSVYETEPVGYDDQPFFLNICAEIMTSADPLELLDITQKIENDLLRVRTVKNGPRTIDLDILLFDDIELDTKRLIIPHPRMYERAFVLRPYAELTGYDGPIPEDKSVVRVGTLML